MEINLDISHYEWIILLLVFKVLDKRSPSTLFNGGTRDRQSISLPLVRGEVHSKIYLCGSSGEYRIRKEQRPPAIQKKKLNHNCEQSRANIWVSKQRDILGREQSLSDIYKDKPNAMYIIVNNKELTDGFPSC